MQIRTILSNNNINVQRRPTSTSSSFTNHTSFNIVWLPYAFVIVCVLNCVRQLCLHRLCVSGAWASAPPPNLAANKAVDELLSAYRGVLPINSFHVKAGMQIVCHVGSLNRFSRSNTETLPANYYCWSCIVILPVSSATCEQPFLAMLRVCNYTWERCLQIDFPRYRHGILNVTVKHRHAWCRSPLCSQWWQVNAVLLGELLTALII